MSTKAYAIKGPDGDVVDITLQRSTHLMNDYTYVPGYFYEGEPKAVAKVVSDGRAVSGTLQFRPSLTLPVGTKLYIHPPGTLALLRDIRNSNGSLPVYLTKRIDATLKEAGE